MKVLYLLSDGYSQERLESIFTDLSGEKVTVICEKWQYKDGIERVKNILKQNFDVILLPMSLRNYSSLFFAKIVHDEFLPVKLIVVSNSRYLPSGLFDQWLVPTWSPQDLGKVLKMPNVPRLPYEVLGEKIKEVFETSSYFSGIEITPELAETLGMKPDEKTFFEKLIQNKIFRFSLILLAILLFLFLLLFFLL
ncbi:hypothetical protein IT568_04760 [bacterium]|nr:hypothetical protein [bacterium]